MTDLDYRKRSWLHRRLSTVPPIILTDVTALCMVNSDLQILFSVIKEKNENLYKWCTWNKQTLNSKKNLFHILLYSKQTYSQ